MERLFDVLHIIFNNLNYDDLMRASQVCSSWNHIAELEKRKRGPKLIDLLYADSDKEDTLKGQVKPLHKSLLAKPAIIFSFASVNGDRRQLGESNYQYLAQFNNLNIVEATLPVVYLENKIGGTVGLFLPERNSVSYDTVSIGKDKIVGWALIDNGDYVFQEIVDKFLTNKEGHKTIIFGCSFDLFVDDSSIETLILHRCKGRFMEKILDCVNQRYEANTYSLWGVYTCTMNSAKTENSQIEFLDSEFFAVTISGPSVQSHSLMLDVDVFLNDGVNLVQDILSKISSNSTMAFFATSIKSFSTKASVINERIKALKDRFPSVQMMTAVTAYKVFGINSHEKESRATVSDDSISILILSYK